MVTRISTLSLFLGLLACAPELDDRSFLISEPRILAIQADPPELAPGEQVSYRVLWAGGAETPSLELAHCQKRKPLAELGPVHPACLSGEAQALEILGEGLSVQGVIPRQACRRFGPDTPEPVSGEPSGRPVDPDSTGGFYQPAVALPDVGGAAVGFARISCGIAGATPALLSEMARRYTRNENPRLEGMEMRRGSRSETLHPLDPPSGANTLRPGEKVELRPSLPACEEAPCGGAERYVYFNPLSRSIEEREEAVQIAWFSEGGVFEADRSLHDTPNTWTAPEAPGVYRIWAVARDDRGGVGWESYILRVE